MLAAANDARGALGALPHAAAVTQVGIGKLLDARANDEVGIVLDLVAVGLTALVQDDDRHCAASSRASIRLAEARVLFGERRLRHGSARSAGARSRHSRDRARSYRAAASARRFRRSSGSAAAARR